MTYTWPSAVALVHRRWCTISPIQLSRSSVAVGQFKWRCITNEREMICKCPVAAAHLSWQSTATAVKVLRRCRSERWTAASGHSSWPSSSHYTTLLKACADPVVPVDRDYYTSALNLLEWCTVTAASVPWLCNECFDAAPQLILHTSSGAAILPTVPWRWYTGAPMLLHCCTDVDVQSPQHNCQFPPWLLGSFNDDAKPMNGQWYAGVLSVLLTCPNRVLLLLWRCYIGVDVHGEQLLRRVPASLVYMSRHCGRRAPTLLFWLIEATTKVHWICWDNALPLLRACPDCAMNVLTLLRSWYYTPAQVQRRYQRICLHADPACALTLQRLSWLATQVLWWCISFVNTKLPAVNVTLLGMRPDALEQSATTVTRRWHYIAVLMTYQYCARALTLLRRWANDGFGCYESRRCCAGGSNIHGFPLLLHRNHVPMGRYLSASVQ
jgi:hypothetical protein